jgi:RNA polymerase sigma-70 factor (ECF subfamily)
MEEVSEVSTEAVSEAELSLIERAKANPEHFTEIYDIYLDQIYRYFYVRTSHKETAEDLTSQTFLQAFAALPRYEPRGLPLGAWLFKIAHNLLVNSYRKPEPYGLDQALELAGGEDILEHTDTKLSIEKIKKFIEELPDRDRDIVFMRSSADLSFAQIAEVIDISEGAARTAYHRAIQKLISLANDTPNEKIAAA